MLEGLHEFKLQVFGQAAYVVVALHHLGSLGAALHDIGIDGTLAEEVDAVELACLLLEYADELAADDLTLLLGVGHVLQLGEEALCGVYIDEVGVELVAEYLNDIL